MQADDLAPVQVLAAGFPCQSFSQAGNRRGFEDPRGALFFEIPRLIGEYEPDERPLLVILENVPHLLCGADGTWFDEVRRALRRAGYWFREESCWTVNVKNATDLPQDRERLFMVAASKRHFTFNPFSPPPASNQVGAAIHTIDMFIDRTRRGADDAYLPPDNRYYKMIQRAMSGGDSDGNVYQLRRSYVREKRQGLCPTLTANMGIGGHNVPFVRDAWGIRRLSVDEVARLQGFDTTDGAVNLTKAGRSWTSELSGSSSSGHGPPRVHRVTAELAHCLASDQMTLDIEGVVDGGVGGEKPLRRS